SIILIYLIIIFIIDFRMGLIVTGLSAIRVVIFYATYKTNRNYMTQSLIAEAESRGYQVQMIGAMETLKSSGHEYSALKHWSDLFSRVLNVSIRQSKLDAWIQALIETLKIVSPLVILVYGAGLVLSGSLELGTMLAINAIAIGCLEPLSQLITNAFQLQRLYSYIERTGEIFQADIEQDQSGLKSIDKLHGNIEVQNASFSYNQRGSRVISDISLSIPAKSFIAITGASGSGKSTLLKLMIGLYKLESGVIEFDGADIQKLYLRQLRQRISVVPQRPYLFTGSIRNNIVMGDNTISLDRVIEAAKTANIHDDIHAMPMGYGTILAESGETLSGGQRQRVALARALVRHPTVLLIDEGTSALDAITEAQIFRQLERLKVTRVVVAHRLSTIKNADIIVVMDNGYIVEKGKYNELMKNDGLFARLVSEQLGD
ncbi:MAG: peptidase domain-containing ABC transporter, partial [Candidatus Saccharimonadales bacterium]